jgi:hypothetical protein
MAQVETAQIETAEVESMAATPISPSITDAGPTDEEYLSSQVAPLAGADLER